MRAFLIKINMGLIERDEPQVRRRIPYLNKRSLIEREVRCLRPCRLWRLTLFAASFLLGGLLYAQNAAPVQLGAEIQQLEQRLSANLSPAERHSALVRLARLRQLSGNIATAAANWLDAAAINPNDDIALISGAYCLAAVGEWERASLTLRPLLTAEKQGPSILQAQFLDAFLKTWSSGNNAGALTALAANPDFAALRPMIYYTLWQTLARNPGMAGADTSGTDAESWKMRLLAEFPKSPEARAANPEKQKDTLSVSMVQSPIWLLLPEATGSAPAVPVATPTAKPAPATPTPIAPITQPAPAATPATPAPSSAAAPAVSAVVLQTGLFGKEANALAQSEALRKAGFTALISRKTVNGTEYCVVTVPVPNGQNPNKLIADLKKAGFDSFPVK